MRKMSEIQNETLRTICVHVFGLVGNLSFCKLDCFVCVCVCVCHYTRIAFQSHSPLLPPMLFADSIELFMHTAIWHIVTELFNFNHFTLPMQWRLLIESLIDVKGRTCDYGHTTHANTVRTTTNTTKYLPL